MKKLLLLFSLTVALTFSTKAQTSVYHPFPDSDAVWHVQHSGYDCAQCYDNNYFIAGDTLINSLVYHKINYFGGGGFMNPNTQFCDYWHYSSAIFYQGAIRQDTAQRKVYFILPGYLTDTLIYDFSLNVGDTLKPGINDQSWPHYITSIDSILIGSNYRKRFNLEYSYIGPIIEGIGSATGLIEDLMTFECGGTLLCFAQNNQNLYPSANCLLLSDGSQLSFSNSFSISPNPFHTFAILSISDSRFTNCKLRIYDVMGRLVRTVAVGNSSNQEIKIERGDLGDGLYFYQLRTNDYELIANGKFVVE